jgi:hypothetical protein
MMEVTAEWRSSFDILFQTILGGADELADQVLAIAKTCVAFRVTCKPNSLDDPLVLLLIKMGAEIGSLQPKLTVEHAARLLHGNTPDDAWTIGWHPDSAKNQPGDDTMILELPEPFSRFCSLWSIRPNHKIFNLIRVA